MTKEALEKATGQELIEQDAIMRDYCGVDGYYGDYLDNVNAEMLKRFNRLAELEGKLANADYQLEGRDNEIRELKERLAIINLNGNIVLRELTKAKEIIKTFLGFAEAFGYSPSMDKFITEAEQFLKESE